jgi:orotidine-5'-phosphate decarboxylase
MTASAANNKSVIVALDVDSDRQALDLVSRLSGFGIAFKVGSRLFTNSGPDLVRKIVDAGHRVFLDLKFHDIPNTVAEAAVEAAKLGVWMLNVHALGGREMMKRAADAVRGHGLSTSPKVIAVTILTSSSAEDISEVGVNGSVDESVTRLASLAIESGLDGVVASGMEAARIRALAAGRSFDIVTPGIRPSSATTNDQKRVMTPSEALSAGSDYLVVGRPIIAADDAEKALESLLEEINTAP